MQNAIVLGSTGKIGNIITQTFQSSNFRVSSLGRRDPDIVGVSHHYVDYNDFNSCYQIFKSLVTNTDSIVFSHRFRPATPSLNLMDSYLKSVETEFTPLFALYEVLQNISLSRPLNIVLISSLAAASISPDTNVSYLALKSSLETFSLNIQSQLNSHMIYSNVLRIGEVCIPSINHSPSKKSLFKLISKLTGKFDVVSPLSIANSACILANASSISLNSSVITIDNGLSKLSVESILRSNLAN